MREMTNPLERRNVELTILNRIAEALNYEVDLPRALQSALENIVKLFDLNTGWIYLLEAEQRNIMWRRRCISPLPLPIIPVGWAGHVIVWIPTVMAIWKVRRILTPLHALG